MLHSVVLKSLVDYIGVVATVKVRISYIFSESSDTIPGGVIERRNGVQ